MQAIAEAELAQDAANVGLDGRLGNRERVCDLAVRETLRDEREHGALPSGQPAGVGYRFLHAQKLPDAARPVRMLNAAFPLPPD